MSGESSAVPISTEVWQESETGWIRTEFGDISLSNVWPAKPGMVENVGSLILVTVPPERDTANLARFGVELLVEDGIAHLRAKNGTWRHRLQPAHWRAGIVPAGWSERIMLGRLIDGNPPEGNRHHAREG